MTAALLLCALAWLALGAAGAALSRRDAGRIVVYGGSLAVSLIALGVAFASLGGGAPGITLPLGLPGIGMRFAVDPLSAAFLVLVDLGGAAASLYALGYGRHEAEPWRVLPFYPVFLAAMNLVVIAADAYGFLLFWELMSLASWALVMADHTRAETRLAGFVYLLMASAGTLMLLLAFGLLAGPHGAYGFASIAAAHRAQWTGAVAMLLALLGAGSKAGLMPLHVWLPRAHPAAPSHVSALMSGVMTKVAVYAFIRIAFDLAGPAAWWWGLVVLAAGAVSAVLGVLQALLEDDVKTVLAYSTIENIGLIFAGLGLALAFRADGLALAASLALTAALFHAFNHMLFKSTLFFGAGAIQHGAGTRRLSDLGGLIHRMQISAVPMLVAAMAIAALPPLNGFASEWLLLQAVLLSPSLPQFGLKLAVPAAGALLALAAAFASACLVRLYGMAYLGRPRSAAAASAHEADGISRAAMIGLASLCLVFGLMPALVLGHLAPVARELVGISLPGRPGWSALTLLPVPARQSSYDPLLIALFIALTGSLAALGLHRFGSRALRRAVPWGCGFLTEGRAALPAGTQYSPAGFSQPIRRVFATSLFRARDEVAMPPPGMAAPASFASRITDPAWDGGALALAALVNRAADRANRLQFLTIRRYLAMVFVTLLILLATVALWA
ncbi:hydrogenase 4 subunit B [Acidiphilium multivorum]|uniref:hydrogenase 4 subunit B n=1 Tax=Acidiphilium multivorum TaxID=62140 RepID=UPI001B8AF140|nr:hydrogenase 4 subunit B [Acidiphilium multivorum]